MTPIPLLIISGPVGVGKSSVAGELSAVLKDEEIAHTLIDLDGLSYTYPRPSDDRFGQQLASQNLAAIWPNCLAAGAKNIIIARTVETREGLDMITRSVTDAAPTICQLYASDDTLSARVSAREIGSGHAWHAARALELSASLAKSGPADFRIDTDGQSLAQIAREIFRQIKWQQ